MGTLSGLGEMTEKVALRFCKLGGLLLFYVLEESTNIFLTLS